MSEKELLESMVIGCKNPNDERGDKDLGRFGSGLKTASFSQASKLTVVSKKSNKISAARFDKERINQTDKWDLEVLDKEELEKSHLEEINDLKSGTTVIWDGISKYQSENQSHVDTEVQIAQDIISLKKHLSHFFHKFMGKGGITFYVNGEKLVPFDPFLTKVRATKKVWKKK